MSHNLIKIYDAILPRSSWGMRSGVFESTILISQILVKMMLVTTVCFWLNNGDRFKTLVTDVGNKRIIYVSNIRHQHRCNQKRRSLFFTWHDGSDIRLTWWLGSENSLCKQPEFEIPVYFLYTLLPKDAKWNFRGSLWDKNS